MNLAIVILTCLLCLVVSEAALGRQSKPTLVVGVDANYAEGMERDQNAVWRWDDGPRELFDAMHARGVDAFRVRLWVGDDGPHGTQAASRVIARAVNAGIDPYLVIFLSDDWSDLMKQPIPAVWKDLDFEQRMNAVQEYSRDVVARLRRDRLQSHLYEIGNEIDYGICGEYPGKRSKKDPASLSRQIWPKSAKLIAASQAGVRKADPNAKFMLHISHWWDADFCRKFFEFMIGHGVQVDYAGLSYFPSANIGGSIEISEFAETATTLAKAIDRPIIVPETAYPNTRDFKGQFSRWKYEAPGYPLTTEGQRRWFTDFLSMCSVHPDIHAVYYWSPEWYGEGMWKGFALFDPNGNSQTAWEAFDRSKRFGEYLPQDLILEIRDDELFRVPVNDARRAMTEKIASLSEQTAGVSVEHIALLSTTQLVVDSYEVGLRSSLQNNMHLTLLPDARGLPLMPTTTEEFTSGINALTDGADSKRCRAVLICRQQISPSVERVAEYLKSQGYAVNVHPLPIDAPIKFGMSGKFGSPPATDAAGQ